MPTPTSHVVLFAVHAEVFNLVEGDRLVLGGIIVRGLVALGVGPEGAQVHLARGDRPDRVHYDRDERVLGRGRCIKERVLLVLSFSEGG